MEACPVPEVTHRKLLFVSGKGGVGKTVVSRAIALTLASRGRRILWVTIEDPTIPMGELTQLAPTLWHLNCDASIAFEEYASMKIGGGRLTQVFLKNKLVRYLSKAAPGIHELVLLGKIWHERLNFDQIVIDMPSTGYGIAMFQSTENFAQLFKGGPVHRDAEAMLASFGDPAETGQLIVALPEEMPLRESLDLAELLSNLFPHNAPAFLVNRRFPHPPGEVAEELPHNWTNPLASSIGDYARKRAILENHNLRLWRERGIPFAELRFVPPPERDDPQTVISHLAEELHSRRYA